MVPLNRLRIPNPLQTLKFKTLKVHQECDNGCVLSLKGVFSFSCKTCPLSELPLTGVEVLFSNW